MKGGLPQELKTARFVQKRLSARTHPSIKAQRTREYVSILCSGGQRNRPFFNEAFFLASALGMKVDKIDGYSYNEPMPKDLIKDKGVKRISGLLDGKKVALAIAGGIGSVETVKLAREFRRHGATVKAFLSREAQKFITPLSLEWATNQKVEAEFDADVAYLDPFDLVVVAPATLNTLAKASLGIADSLPLILIASQIGAHRKIVWVPTMNEQMFAHPLITQYQTLLSKWQGEFFISNLEENRLKMPEPSVLVEFCIQCLKN